jgi:hypothetical protein
LLISEKTRISALNALIDTLDLVDASSLTALRQSVPRAVVLVVPEKESTTILAASFTSELLLDVPPEPLSDCTCGFESIESNNAAFGASNRTSRGATLGGPAAWLPTSEVHGVPFGDEKSTIGSQEQPCNSAAAMADVLRCFTMRPL